MSEGDTKSQRERETPNAHESERHRRQERKTSRKHEESERETASDSKIVSKSMRE